MIKSSLLFAVHRGESFSGGIGTLTMGAWPIAMSDRVYSGQPRPYEELDGFWALWQAAGSPEDFGMCAFGGRDLAGQAPDKQGWGGLWVYEVSWREDDVNPECGDCTDPDAWGHLHHGSFRRPMAHELAPAIGSEIAHDWQVVL